MQPDVTLWRSVVPVGGWVPVWLVVTLLVGYLRHVHVRTVRCFPRLLPHILFPDCCDLIGPGRRTNFVRICWIYGCYVYVLPFAFTTLLPIYRLIRFGCDIPAFGRCYGYTRYYMAGNTRLLLPVVVTFVVGGWTTLLTLTFVCLRWLTG